jgi:hypothetical protein
MGVYASRSNGTHAVSFNNNNNNLERRTQSIVHKYNRNIHLKKSGSVNASTAQSNASEDDLQESIVSSTIDKDQILDLYSEESDELAVVSSSGSNRGVVASSYAAPYFQSNSSEKHQVFSSSSSSLSTQEESSVVSTESFGNVGKVPIPEPTLFMVKESIRFGAVSMATIGVWILLESVVKRLFLTGGTVNLYLKAIV